MVSNKLLLFLFLVVIIGIYTIAGYFIISPEPLIIQGEVEAAQIRVSSKIAGRVETLHIKEGNSVEKGQLLVSIESPEIDAKLKQAKAAKRAATAQKTKADKGTRKEKIISVRNMWLKAKAAEDLAEKTFKRVKNLHEDGVLPAQKMDEAKAQYISAQRTREAAKANFDMATRGARQEDKTAAEAMMNKAEGAVAEVEAYLKETQLSAPLKSEVANIVPKVGELITPGFPIVTLVDLEDIWVTFNLREDLLSDIRMGSVITAKFPALGNREIKLKINYITALGQYATWHATKASGDFDLKTFEIRGILMEKIEGLRPGMSALVAWN
ncbi:MAG: biotin/lipoyl-binding protein [Desulfobacteraceae bacterium]|nr:biotin/lipoyl-binding protein [Desulfobacteraceae bacterium]